MADEQAKKTERVRRPSAQKRMIQNEKRRVINKMFKSQVNTVVRAFEAALEAKNKEVLQERLNSLYSLMDQGVKRGIFKPNKASRTKARATQKVSSLA